MSGTRDVLHVALVFLQSSVSTTGRTRTGMVFEFVDRRRLHSSGSNYCLFERALCTY